jgi:hypothetical protein
LASAAAVLKEATTLEGKCPHWFVIALWVGIGQSWDRQAFEQVFEAGVELEPTYYYLYQVKAMYLLPRWFGREGEWERFAEESTLKVGGDQGDIVFFDIYSNILTMHDLTFMNTHYKACPRLLNGFRAIEKWYGASLHRLSEACYFAMTSGDQKTREELFTRIGDDYDETVWRSQQNFEMFRGGIFPRKLNQDHSTTRPTVVGKKAAQK